MIDSRRFFNGQRVVVFDIETTGTSMDFDSIIEFGAVEFIDGSPVKEHEMLFSDGISSPYLVKSIHHIGEAERVGKPKVSECVGRICDILSNCVMVTHNGKKFDVPFITRYLDAAGLRISNSRLVDTIVLARRLEFKSNSLEFLSRHYGVEYGAHRGLGDAKSTYEIMMRLFEDLGIRTLEDVKC